MLAKKGRLRIAEQMHEIRAAPAQLHGRLRSCAAFKAIPCLRSAT